MDMLQNAFKAALKAGKRQIGVWSTISDGGTVEMMAGCGFDWMVIDTEHSPTDAVATMPLMQAAQPYPVSTVVRVGWNDKVEIKKVLDCGAQSVLVPYVQNAEEAAAAVAAVRYPPRGVRGVAGSTRSSRYGAIADYPAQADAQICLLVQVETREALKEIEAIAAVDGVDGIFIGPADLAASMGHLGKPLDPEVRAAVLDGIRRIAAAGVPPGILSTDTAFLKEAEAAGARFIAIDVDMALLRRSLIARLNDWQ